MRQHIGALFTTIAVLILIMLRDFLFTILAVLIYIVGITIILFPQRKPSEAKTTEEEQKSKPPTPEELKKRPAQPPEIG